MCSLNIYTESGEGCVDSMSTLMGYYNRYNNKKARKSGLAPPAEKYAEIGFRATPRRGTAIMWPNVNLDNVYEQVFSLASHRSTGAFPYNR